MSQQWPPPGWHPPGWYPYPPDPPSERWWDGTQWTARVRRADRDTWTTLLLIAVAGLVVVVLGGVLWTDLVSSDYSSTDPSSTACSDQTLIGGLAPLWLPWLALVAIVVWATVVALGRTRNDWRVVLFVLAGWTVAAGTCPVLTVLLGGMNCGL